MADTHNGHSRGDMSSLRTRADYPEQRFDVLAHEAGPARAGRGLHFKGKTEIRTLGSMPVLSSIPRRSGEYTTNFSHTTGG